MYRRSFVLGLSTALLAAACSGRSVPRKIIVSPQKLQQLLGQRFPHSYPVAGLLQLQLQTPVLQLQPDKNLLKAQLLTNLSGPALKQSYAGRMEVDFSLRYAAADRTLRAQRVAVQKLALDGLPPAITEMLATYGKAIAEQALEDAVLYQLQPKDLELMDSFDLQPGLIRVTPQGLEIALERKSQV